MSNKKRKNQVQASIIGGQKPLISDACQADTSTNQTNKTNWFAYLKTHWWAVGIIAFLSLGALGGGLRYLEDDAKRQQSDTKTLTADLKQQSLLNRINPFISAPLPPPSPTLSKEYVYAGARLLSVENANANAAPPADLAVWRSSNGYFYILGGAGSQQTFFQWGTNGDVPVPGDYDGDGKTDFSIFRPSTNTWWVMKSSDTTYYGYTFGLSGDKVAQADYDGDGKTDVAVFRPSTGYWYIGQSATNDYIGVQFGLGSDTPAPADYDGDGKADIAVWRNSNSTFYSINSSNNLVQTMSFTQSSTKPVSADYDGDGKADYAIRNDANWIIKQSSNNVVQNIPWQNTDDKEVPNDYDGDGKVDIAVWRNATGYWYIRNSADLSTRTVQWGQANDIPVPAYYRR